MATVFDYNENVFKAFSSFYKKAPRLARKASARLLTQFAAGTRDEAIDEINRSMTVRNKRFVTSSMRFKKAVPRSIDNQQSETFSISRPRSSGFKEQQEGGRDTRTRSQSLLARRNSFDRKVAPKARMKPNGKFFRESDAKPRANEQKVPALIRYMKKNHKNKSFIVQRKYKQIKRGLYVIKRNKMMILQNFEKKPRVIKKNPWMSKARMNFFKNNDIQSQWNRAIKFVTKPRRF